MSGADKIRNDVKVIQLLINTEFCINLLKEDPIQYQEHMKQLYPDFPSPSLFKKIILKQDISMLESFLQAMDDVHNGTREEKDITANIGETLAEKYLYPVLGKPESTTENQPKFVTK